MQNNKMGRKFTALAGMLKSMSIPEGKEMDINWIRENIHKDNERHENIDATISCINDIFRSMGENSGY